MLISDLLFFAFATMGLSNVIVESDIAEPIRSWWEENTTDFFKEAIRCHQCVGWWSGLLCSFLLFKLSFWFIPIALGCAFAGSFLSTFEKVIRNYIITRTTYIDSMEAFSLQEENEH